MKTQKGIQTTQGNLTGDEYSKLWSPGWGLSQRTAPHARVSFSYTLGVEFGTEKVAATVTLDCDQTESVIDRAGELAFTKAVELVNDAWSELTRKKTP